MTEIKYLAYTKGMIVNLMPICKPCATYEEALGVIKEWDSPEEVYIAEVIYSKKAITTISYEEWRKGA